MADTLKRAAGLTGCAARHWSSDNASTTGAALAFFSAFPLAPLLVIILTITGSIVGSQAAYGQIGSQLNALFGTSTAKIILDAMKARKAQSRSSISLASLK